MTKLTESNYRLPVIKALSEFNLFTHGTTLPLAIWGVDTVTGQRGQFVAKFKNSGRMTLKSSAFELIGAWMAMEVDLPVVEPALIDVTPEFVNTSLKGRPGYRIAAQSLGINFGSKYVSGFASIPDSSFTLPDTLIEKAKRIYVFDIFIANIDRGHQRPNIASNGKEILIYDHELAFSFLQALPTFRNKTPWILDDSDRELYKKHFFYSLLNKLKPDLTPQVELLSRFNDEFWGRVYNLLPEEWQDDSIKEIGVHLASIVKNRSYFAESLNKTFAV